MFLQTGPTGVRGLPFDPVSLSAVWIGYALGLLLLGVTSRDIVRVLREELAGAGGLVSMVRFDGVLSEVVFHWRRASAQPICGALSGKGRATGRARLCS